MEWLEKGKGYRGSLVPATVLNRARRRIDWCWLESLCPRPLVTASALLLNGWAGYRSIRTKHAAIAGLRLKQRLAVAAFIKILTRIRGHDLLLRMAAAWAGEDGLQDDRAHGFVKVHNCLVAFCMICSLHHVRGYGVKYDRGEAHNWSLSGIPSKKRPHIAHEPGLARTRSEGRRHPE